MKNTLLFATLSMLVFSISSCNLDIGPGNPKNIDPIVLEDRYDEDITLTNHNEDGVDYIATGRVEIFDGTMTIEAGVIVQFEEGTYLNIGIDGKLSAVGTSSEPIRMIGEGNTPSWAGIYINTDLANRIHHVQIENAGEGTSFGVFNDFPAAITLDGKVSIENTTISKSGSMGIVINGKENDITSFSGNTIKTCTEFPIHTNINTLASLDLASNIFSENGKNMIAVTDRYSDRLEVRTELDGLEIPYFFSGDFELYQDLTLNRGVELVMDDNSLIEHTASDNYKLEIKGTADEHVVIRGAESESAYWKGIYITSRNNKNEFSFLDISDGGSDKLTFESGKANISLEFGANLLLNECTSARSGDCEVFISAFGGDNTEFVNNSPAITKICRE